MNEYNVTVYFRVTAENEEQARNIVGYEIEENIRFKRVPYSKNDSGIVNFCNIGVEDKDTDSVQYKMTVRS
jgi:hypothetical protein